MKNCELCSSVARLVCESDAASLCFECDAKVHGANFLVARHQRLLLCRRCHSPTPWRADGPRLGPTVSLCRRCLLHKNNQRHHHHDHDDEEGESTRNQEEEDQDDADDEEEEEEEGEEQVVPWATGEEEKDTTPPPPPVASSSSSEEETASTAAATARERSGLLKRRRENTIDLPTSPCSSFSRDRLSDQPRQPAQTGSECNIDDEATSDSFRPLKSRTLLRSAPRHPRLATVNLVVSGPRRAPI